MNRFNNKYRGFAGWWLTQKKLLDRRRSRKFGHPVYGLVRRFNEQQFIRRKASHSGQRNVLFFKPGFGHVLKKAHSDRLGTPKRKPNFKDMQFLRMKKHKPWREWRGPHSD